MQVNYYSNSNSTLIWTHPISPCNMLATSEKANSSTSQQRTYKREREKRFTSGDKSVDCKYAFFTDEGGQGKD